MKKTTLDPHRTPLIHVFTERNSKINLSAIRTQEAVYQKHILDALEIKQCFDLHEYDWKKACDIGTGGWFPLLPLAIEFPDIQRTGIDGRRKKIDAINDMTKTLWLKNCRWIHSRSEDHNTKYDLVTARAVAFADTLLPRIDEILKPWGVCILYKLFTSKEDRLIKKFGRKIIKTHAYTLHDDAVERMIYILKK